MHELTVAMDIIEIVLKEAETNSVSQIFEVQLKIGNLSGIDAEALQFNLKFAVKETILEHTVFTIHTVSGYGRCNSCNRDFEMQDLLSSCPDCRKPASSIVRGREMKVLSILAE
jgi:hydrogenase nickel incorporation protein HypA/HybF